MAFGLPLSLKSEVADLLVPDSYEALLCDRQQEPS